MKIVIKFNKKYKKPENIRKLIQLDSISDIILKIIDDKTAIGKSIVNYKGEEEYRIVFRGIKE